MSEIRNFNESLLYHTVTNSQVNLSHPSASQRSARNLFTDLNKAYSNLTVQSPYQPMQSQFQSRFVDCPPKLPQPDRHFIEQQPTQQCVNCQKIRRRLKHVQRALKCIQSNFIQKELLLIDRFTQINKQLNRARQQCQKYKGLYIKTQKQLDEMKEEAFKPPKIQLICTRNYKKHKEQPLECLSTMESNCDPLSKRQQYKPIKNHNRIRSYYEGQNDIGSRGSICHDSSDSISVSLQYTESDLEQFEDTLETNRSKQTDPIDKGKMKPVFAKVKSNNSIHIPKYPEPEIANTKKYNSSLVERGVKPKKLASKIFNLNRN